MSATREAIAGRLRVGALIGAAGESAVGLAALVGGWWLGIDLLRQPIPAYTSIRAGTALGLVLLAVGVLAAGLSWPRWIPVASGALLAAGAVAILGGYATGSPKAALESWVALHVDEDLAAPGRIAVNTAACFLLGGVGLLLLALRRADSARQGLGVAVSFVAYTAVLGYATSGFQVAGRFTAEHTEMAMQTAIPMLVAGFCLVLVDVERGWGQVIAEPLAGGRLVRAFLPLVLLLFLLAAFVYAIAVRRHLQSAVETLIIAGLAVLMSVGLLFVARPGAACCGCAHRSAPSGTSTAKPTSGSMRSRTSPRRSGPASSSRTASGATGWWRTTRTTRCCWSIPRGSCSGPRRPCGRSSGSTPRTSTAGVVRERHWQRADGSALWMVDSIALLRDDEGDPQFFVLHAQDNTVAHRVRDELAHRANHDPLTGLLNGDQVREHLWMTSGSDTRPSRTCARCRSPG